MDTLRITAGDLKAVAEAVGTTYSDRSETVVFDFGERPVGTVRLCWNFAKTGRYKSSLKARVEHVEHTTFDSPDDFVAFMSEIKIEGTYTKRHLCSGQFYISAYEQWRSDGRKNVPETMANIDRVLRAFRDRGFATIKNGERRKDRVGECF